MRWRAMGSRTSTPKRKAAPLVALHETQQHVHGGGLARAVGAEKPEHFSRPHLQVQAIDGHLFGLAGAWGLVLHPQLLKFDY